jgi:hypothetical protein
MVLGLLSNEISRREGTLSESIGNNGKFPESCGRVLEGKALDVPEELDVKAGEKEVMLEVALRRPGVDFVSSPRWNFSKEFVFKDNFEGA